MSSCDVAIVGGGPAGTTVATLLKKYSPDLRVTILEKEKFPRDHIGESQLPVIAHILDEMGVWDKVEAADFPVKIGATFTWGRHGDTWDFDFYPADRFVDEQRPARFEGQRKFTAFQVDRQIYDTILLDHAREMGVEVREQTRVERVHADGDRIEAFELDGGERIEAAHYVDASGSAGLVRRAMGVESRQPVELRNVAIWDYWDNAEWAVRIGVGGTRIQVRSLPYGWIWFIPLGPTRTSLGLVCPSEHYKDMGLSIEDLYRKAIDEQPEIKALIANATPDGNIQATKDWSHLSDRLAGENWFLCGEAAGFADPILSAGMSLAHQSGREVAYSIMELGRGELEDAWIRSQYDERNRKSIEQHIRFALYWYSANDRFTDLKDHCRHIAGDAGLDLNPDAAWRWLAQGGFVNVASGSPVFGSFDLASAKGLVEFFHGESLDYSFDRCNVFRLKLEDAEQRDMPLYQQGRIRRVKCLTTGARTLPLAGYYQTVVQTLRSATDISRITQTWTQMLGRHPVEQRNIMMSKLLSTLEAMVLEGWVEATHDASKPMVQRPPDDNPFERSRSG